MRAPGAGRRDEAHVPALHAPKLACDSTIQPFQRAARPARRVEASLSDIRGHMPNYTWVCGACSASNPPGLDACVRCHCPAQSSSQTRQKYRDAFEGNGLSVAPEIAAPDPGQRARAWRARLHSAGGAWWKGAIASAVVAFVAFIVLWGAEPLSARIDGGPPHGPTWWPLDITVAFFAVLTVLLAPFASLACVVVALRADGRKGASNILLAGGVSLLLALAVALFIVL